MNVKIKTLTPIHIGSGTFFHYNTDYFTYRLTNGDVKVGITDERKVLDLIGLEHIQNWVNSIERGQNTRDFVRVYCADAKVSQYTKRTMYLYAKANEGDTLKEHIHNGAGLPYIPGSSIKGALRTAVIAAVASRTETLDAKVLDRNGRVSASSFEKNIFGSDPNADVFRFLQCGDAYFGAGTEIAFRMQMYLNITQRDDLHPNSDTKPQIIEAIGTDEETTFQLNLKSQYYQWAKQQAPSSIGNMPNEMSSITKLFETVNRHTKNLLDEDIAFWNDRNETGAEGYISLLEQMSTRINHLIQEGNKSCILRLGHSIGWNFITGGWSKQLTIFENVVVPAARPNNKRYNQYPFPKSRRLDSDGEILGFVMLST